MATWRHLNQWGIAWRFAWRELRSSPAATVMAVLVLGLAGGAASSAFAALDALILRKLAVADPERLLRLTIHTPANEVVGLSVPMFRELASRSTPFDPAIGWLGDIVIAVGAGGRFGLASVWAVTDRFGDALGERPALGRWLGTHTPNGRGATEPSAVIGYRFWQQRFGGDPQVLGRLVRVEARSFVVVGVMGPTFTGLSGAVPPDVIIPLTVLPELELPVGPGKSLDNPEWLGLSAGGRLSPGVEAGQACAALGDWFADAKQRLAPHTPEARAALVSGRLQCDSVAYGTDLAERSVLARPFYVVLGVAAALMCVAALHVAMQMVERIGRRTADVGVHLALGASAASLMGQFLATSAIVAVLGSAVGFAVSLWGGRHLVHAVLQRAALPVSIEVRPSWLLVGFSLTMVAIAVAICAGPLRTLVRSQQAAHILRRDQPMAQATSGRLMRLLMAGQIALAVAVVTAAGSVHRTLQAWTSSIEGFDRANIQILQLYPQPNGYEQFDGNRYYRQLLDGVERVDGVAGAAFTNYEPGGAWKYKTRVSAGAAHPAAAAGFVVASPGALDLLGVRLIEGRGIAWTDTVSSPLVAVVSPRLASALFPRGTAIGRTLSFDELPDRPRVTIVGVAADSRLFDIREAAPMDVYVAWLQHPQYTQWSTMLIVRRTAAATVVSERVRQAVEAESREYVLSSLSAGGAARRALSYERLVADTATAFAVLAVVLVMAGGLASASAFIRQRRREIGIRVAVGAASADVVRLCVRSAMPMTLLGAALGVPLAFAVQSLLRSNVDQHIDASLVSMVAVAGCLASVCASVTVLLARAAARRSPLAALRGH